VMSGVNDLRCSMANVASVVLLYLGLAARLVKASVYRVLGKN